jgi:hypothetical protein
VEIEKQGNLFFTREDFMLGHTEVPHVVLVCGYPVQANIITDNPTLLVMDGGQWFQYSQVKLGSLAFQSTLLRPKAEELAILPVGFDCDAEEFAFCPFLGKINSRPESGVTSAVGMSGGPVVAVYPQNERAFFEPRLLGMQVSQKYIERQDEIEITQLTAVSGSRLLNWIGNNI